MKLPVYFINKPVFATILNFIIIVVGLLAIQSINLREYPDITTPDISIDIPYDNASPEVVESEITFIAEDELASIKGLEMISSTSAYGTSNINLTFSDQVDFSSAMSEVREKISVLRSKLPKEISEPKIIESSANAQPFFYISVLNKNRKPEELAHFTELNLKNNFRSLPGVANAKIWGHRYIMAIKLDREKLFFYKVNTSEIIGQLKKYSRNLAAGKINDTISVTIDISATTPEDFGEIVIKRYASSNVKLKDVANIELVGDTDDFKVRVNGEPGTVLAITKTVNANPLEVSEAINARLKNISATLPPGYTLQVELDKSDFIRASLSNVKSAIIEAVLLVVIIIFLFLRNFRAALIPLLTIPICLAGTVAMLKMFGFSLNTLTLLAMVLSIGLVVDDAIVILENIFKHIEAGEPPFVAAKKGSAEIGFAVVAMTLTLTSVFIPIAFIEGDIGKLFIEFAVALAGSVIISGVVALTLSPMIASRFLKEHEHNFLEQIDVFLKNVGEKYRVSLLYLIDRKKVMLPMMTISILGCMLLYYFLPSEVAPKEDRGFVGLIMEKSSNISKDKLEELALLAQQQIDGTPEVEKKFMFLSDEGVVATKLKPWSQRSRSAEEVRQSYQSAIAKIPSLQIFAWSWDSDLPGISNGFEGGISFLVKTTDNYNSLLANLEKLKTELGKLPFIGQVRYNLELNSIGYDVKFDQRKLSYFSFSPQDASTTLSSALDEFKVDTFLKDGISYDIKLSSQYTPQNLDEIYLFEDNAAIAVGAISDYNASAKAKSLKHYNQMRGAKITIELKPDVKFSDALTQLTNFLATQHPENITFEFDNNIKKFLKTYGQMSLLILLAIFFIYAILAIQFESFIDPLIIICTVPLGCFGALLFTKLSGNSLNIFSQIGIVTLIGLLSKHAIMIVEFANNIVHESQKPLTLAIVEASQLRLRPILMTTFAMVFGSLPLILSSGAGAEARHAIGWVLIGGLTIGTVFTIFLIPFIYLLIKRSSPDVISA